MPDTLYSVPGSAKAVAKSTERLVLVMLATNVPIKPATSSRRTMCVRFMLCVPLSVFSSSDKRWSVRAVRTHHRPKPARMMTATPTTTGILPEAMNTDSKELVEAGVTKSKAKGIFDLVSCASAMRSRVCSMRNCNRYIHVPRIIHPNTAG